MHLWNDYEGQTLAGAFPLHTLLRTEGRSASFSTLRAGSPAVIRVTEALNDQQVMLARYRAIQAVGQPNLVEVEEYGEAEFDGTPLVYVIMEPTQESLADILRERRLTVEETGEVATSILGALEALHARGLVHGHVEPASVLAAGEVIKLRSDCVRPPADAGESAHGSDDLLGFVDLLHQALTQQQLQDASDALALPEPYASIVRNTVRGTWGMEQVAAELRRFVRPVPVSAPSALMQNGDRPASAAVRPSAPAASSAAATGRSTVPAMAASAEAESPSFAEALAAADRVVDLAARSSAADAARAASLSAAPFSSRAGVAQEAQLDKKQGARPAQLPLDYAAASDRDEDDHESVASRWPQSPIVWVGGAAVLLLLAVLVWHFTGTSTHGTPAGTAAAVPSAAAPAHPAPRPSPATNLAPAAVASNPRPTAIPSGTATATGPAWRVIAYTYNREGQALAKVHTIAQRHPELKPEVFSPSGHAPYLVSLGGRLTERAAMQLRQEARKDGLARDVFARNYSH